MCLMTLSACSTAPIKTQTITVYTPKYVSLPDELTRQVPEPSIHVDTNRDLSDLALAFQIALAQANRQLEAIRAVQP
jgi:hypothetical protein